MSESAYRTIKGSIADGIAAGQWQAGAVLPSEHTLCRSFGVSRMTVNRAMRELATERVVRRVPGVGTFVAAPAAAQSGLVEIHNIAAEIASRGGLHHADILQVAAVAAPDAVAREFDMAPGAAVFHSMIVHYENARRLQLEDRFVKPVAAPHYLAQNFRQATPNEYRSRVAPLSWARHVVEALAASPEIAGMLGLAAGAPCLFVSRRTWSGNLAVSMARLTYPGDRFSLSGWFSGPSSETDGVRGQSE